jgi:hypothetical protein
MIRRFGRFLLLLLPVVVLGVYVRFIADYMRYLDKDLRLIPPSTPGVPEDILGFGFWFTWPIFLALLLGACASVYRTVGQRRAYYLLIGIGFAALSVVDFYLYPVASDSFQNKFN